MYYVLLDITGNLLASFKDEAEARAALDQLVEDDPSAGEDVALMTYDDEGQLAADPVFVVSTVAVAVQAELREQWFRTTSEGDLESGAGTNQIDRVPVG